MRKNIPQWAGAMSITREQSAGVVLFSEDSGTREYLLIHYPHGHWEFARGHIEEGETEREAAKREVHEETGITVDKLVKNFRHTFSFWYIARGAERADRIKKKRGLLVTKEVVFFLARVEKQKAIISHEHVDYQWLSYDAACQRLTHRNAKKLLQKVEKHLTRRRKAR